MGAGYCPTDTFHGGIKFRRNHDDVWFFRQALEFHSLLLTLYHIIFSLSGAATILVPVAAIANPNPILVHDDVGHWTLLAIWFPSNFSH